MHVLFCHCVPSSGPFQNIENLFFVVFVNILGLLT